jgi:hypothetical protein
MYWNDAWSSPLESSARNQQKTDPDPAPPVLYDRNAPSNALITLGPGLVEAHKLESEVAVYPRVIFSPRLMGDIEKMAKETPTNAAQGIHEAAHAVFLCSPVPENRFRCLLDFIRADSDGVPFLDLFHRDIDRNDTQQIERKRLPDGRTETRCVRDGLTHEEFMLRTRAIIEGFLNEESQDTEKEKAKVRAKCLWLANYFNTAVSQYNIEPIPIEWR